MLTNYDVTFPEYSIGDRVYEKIGAVCRPYGNKAVIVGGKQALEAAGEEISKHTKEQGISITGVLWYGGEASYENVNRLMEGFQAVRLHYVATDGSSQWLRESLEKMDEKTFQLYLKYHLATCEREDLLGITSHAVDIFQTQ